MSSIAIDHQLARMAAGRLDMLADDLEGGLLQRSDALRPVPAAADPVSRHTAQVLRQVSASFEQSCLGGRRRTAQDRREPAFPRRPRRGFR
ncbi:hypothetical protein [Nocardia sp. SC052]|uniref:hypothetical protein n=1 Tax=Nocardia sichangensis TaxID=3385975 RepID=UPI0039A02EF2